MAYFHSVRRNGEDVRRLARWSDPPAGDPHRDVTGALHDVSNALTVLLGWVAEARAGRASPAELDRALAIIEDRARSARDLARRAIGSEATIDEREQALDTVVDDVVEALSVEAQRAGVDLVVAGHCPGVCLPLAADASQVLTNILMNALAWAPPDSRVTVELVADEGGVGVTVRDEGPGVAPGQKDWIFDGATSREGGAGVGLKHARAVARAAGGDLDLGLRRLGAGGLLSGSMAALGAGPRGRPGIGAASGRPRGDARAHRRGRRRGGDAPRVGPWRARRRGRGGAHGGRARGAGRGHARRGVDRPVAHRSRRERRHRFCCAAARRTSRLSSSAAARPVFPTRCKRSAFAGSASRSRSARLSQPSRRPAPPPRGPSGARTRGRLATAIPSEDQDLDAAWRWATSFATTRTSSAESTGFAMKASNPACRARSRS